MARPRCTYNPVMKVNLQKISIAIANTTDEEAGKWLKKAIADIYSECSAKDTDKMVKEAFESNKAERSNISEKNRKNYVKRKNLKSSAAPGEQTHSPNTNTNTTVKSIQGAADELLVYGVMENVRLTKDQHISVIKAFGNINTANREINNLSTGLSDGKVKSSNHFATLIRWANRNAEREEKKPTSFAQQERDRQARMLGLRTDAEVLAEMNKQRQQQEDEDFDLIP